MTREGEWYVLPKNGVYYGMLYMQGAWSAVIKNDSREKVVAHMIRNYGGQS